MHISENTSVNSKTSLIDQNTVTNKVNVKRKVDLWVEIKKRWLVLGILLAVTLAVLSPKTGAAGGVLRGEYVCVVCRAAVYYCAGRRGVGRGGRGRARLAALSAAHALLAAPALLLPLVAMLRAVGLHHAILQGAIFSSVGGPCAWLSLALSRSPAAAALTALNYVLSLLVAPLVMFLLCGRAAGPPAGVAARALGGAALPYCAGVLRPAPRAPLTSPRLAAVLLLYAECCQLLADAEGSLYVGDVLVTLVLEVVWVSMSAGLSCLYWRCGLLGDAPAFTLALCAVPKSLDTGWDFLPCTASGLARLPAVFLAPTQALLLAAVTADDDDDDEEYEDIA